jgi:lipopolysaccharide/colanic/teichoic acid biosynthesis glycosyltransferase
MRFPASRGSFRIRFSFFDVLWAAAAPALALYLRDVSVASSSRLEAAELYCIVSFASSLVAFLIFRIREGIVHHFSVHDALEVAKAVVFSGLLTMLAMFTAVRMDGIPRSTPIIHALILATGLIARRVVARVWHDDQSREVGPSEAAAEYIVIIGCTRLSSLYTRLISAYSAKRYKVAALLDRDPRMAGKSIDGVRVVGPPDQLGSLIEEYAEHGIAIARVLVGGDATLLTPDELDDVERICTDHNLTLEFIPALVGLERGQTQTTIHPQAAKKPAVRFYLPPYFRFKRVADIIIGLILLSASLPLLLLVAGIVLLDVGSPVLFWQQRVGLGGRPFLLHKFRTLKPLFDERGLPIGTSDRVSWIGALLRKMRLDELPQLLNVLVGDMSLVGPRPLLPQDQPPDASLRLAVRPGITGWAQVSGGNSLSAETKAEYDEWYVRNASFGLDLRILLMTLGFLLRGERYSPKALDKAPDLQRYKA